MHKKFQEKYDIAFRQQCPLTMYECFYDPTRAKTAIKLIAISLCLCITQMLCLTSRAMRCCPSQHRLPVEQGQQLDSDIWTSGSRSQLITTFKAFTTFTKLVLDNWNKNHIAQTKISVGMSDLNLLSSTFLVLMMVVAICGVGLNTVSVFHFAKVTNLTCWLAGPHRYKFPFLGFPTNYFLAVQ